MSEPSELELQFDRLWELLYPEIDLEVEQKIIPDRKWICCILASARNVYREAF